MHNSASIVALTALTTPNLADGTATWLYDVTTQNGERLDEPGETATNTHTLLMEPFEGDDHFVAIGATIFDTLGDAGAAAGLVLGWEVHNGLDELTGDLTTTDGVNLYDTTAGQLTLGGGPFTSANPIAVLSFEWQPDAYAMFDVGYDTVSDIEGEQIVLVWAGATKHTASSIEYPVIDSHITFAVVPAPAALAPLALLAARRRRTPTDPGGTPLEPKTDPTGRQP
jgi:hypothetical protein